MYRYQYHVIFCPKYRRLVLPDAVAARLKVLVTAKQDEYGYMVLGMEILLDHVHLLLDVHPPMGIASAVARIKSFTSDEVRAPFPWLKRHLPTHWTRSKFISPVGAVTLGVVQAYMASQKGV